MNVKKRNLNKAVVTHKPVNTTVGLESEIAFTGRIVDGDGATWSKGGYKNDQSVDAESAENGKGRQSAKLETGGVSKNVWNISEVGSSSTAIITTMPATTTVPAITCFRLFGIVRADSKVEMFLPLWYRPRRS